MTIRAHLFPTILPGVVRRMSTAMALSLAFIIVAPPLARAQNFSVLYSFTGQQEDGAEPLGGLTQDATGKLFGSSSVNLSGCCGDAFQISNRGSGWVFTNINDFFDPIGGGPEAPLLIGADGLLYGTALGGEGLCDGQANTCGTVYSLRRPPTAVCDAIGCQWTGTLLYTFTPTSGFSPGGGLLTMDSSGDLYGTTQDGGSDGAGVVYELTPANGGWSQSVLWTIPAMQSPVNSGVIFDRSGNLYGETLQGIYELTPSGTGWVQTTVHSWRQQDGTHPYGGLIFDQSGNLYGTTSQAGPNGGGTVFELTPSGGGWTLSVLYAFSGPQGPHAGVVMDAAGNLYGTTYEDGAYSQGSVFKLTRTGDAWTYTDLYDFTGGDDGAKPLGYLVVDQHDNVFGTTWQGGPYSCPGSGYHCGVVWEITP